MFFCGNKEIDVIEYTCDSARKDRIPLVQEPFQRFTTMKFSSVKLSVALARTILSSDPSNLDLRFQFLSSFFNMQSIIDTRNKNLRLNIAKKFRDFSKSSRNGELAQALNYIFIQEKLHIPFVVDFTGFKENYNRTHAATPTYRGKEPDFIALRGQNITLFESKGSLPEIEKEGLKSELKKGLKQCDHAKDYIDSYMKEYTVDRTYASGVWFSKPDNNWNTVLHFSDPIYLVHNDMNDLIGIIKYHYCSWFALFGEYKIVFDLLDGESTFEIDFDESIEIENNEFYIFRSRPRIRYSDILNEYYFLHNIRVKAFGISSKVWKRLKQLNEKVNIDDINFEPISNDKMELFSDGTLLLFEGCKF